MLPSGWKSHPNPQSLGERKQRHPPEERGGSRGSELGHPLSEGVFLFSEGRNFRGGFRERSQQNSVSFPGVSFDILMSQDEHIEGSGSFSGQFHLQSVSPEGPDQGGSGRGVWSACSSESLVQEDKTLGLLAGCKPLGQR